MLFYLRKIIPVVLLFFSVCASAQLEMADSSNRVIIKPFSPPTGAVIQDLLYTQAKIFLAPDIFGKNHNLLNYRGKSVILYFIKKDCDNCKDGLGALKELKEQYGNSLEIFAFSNENKSTLLKYYNQLNPGYNIMFNSKVFGEMMYAGSLGYPRLFYINKEGYTTKIIPGETFEQTGNSKNLILKTIQEIEGGRKEIHN